MVAKLLTAGRFRVRSLLLTEPAFESLASLLAAAGSPAVYLAREVTIRGVVGFPFHRGCLALGERVAESSLDAVFDPPGPARRLLVVLEGVTNPDNLGAIFRNAVAFGAAGVMLSPGCGDPLYRKALRVSMGGVLETPYARAPDWPHALQQLRQDGFTLMALVPRAPVAIAEFGALRPVPGRTALLVGAEGGGLSPEVRRTADLEVAIPMAPGVDSLNVGTAVGIALHRLCVP